MKYPKKKKDPQSTLNWITAALVIFTGVSVLVNYFMWDQMSKQTKTSQEVNRPYVFPGTPTAKFNDYGERLLLLPIVNYGHTPAYGVYHAISYQKWKPYPDPKVCIFSDSIYDENVLPPNSTVTIHIPQNKFYWSSKDSTCREFVIGKIWYSDSWNTKRHYTTFLYRMISRYDSSFEKYYEIADTNK